MRRAQAFVALAALALGACHQRDTAAGTLDAGADARARTAAKTLADLAAAERASATALPRAIVAPSGRAEAPVRVAPAATAVPAADAVENAADPNL